MTQSQTDEELMRLYLSGDIEAFNEIYRRHSSKVYSYLLKRTQKHQDADEIYQMIFLKFHHSRHQYQSKYLVLQWLFVIAKTVLIDFRRKTARQIPESSEHDLNEIEDLSLKHQEHDLTALDHLSKDQRQIVEWRVLDEISYEEIAQRVNRSQESIRQTISRALKRLKNVLESKGSKNEKAK